MNDVARYNPTVTDLILWARKRAEAYRRMPDMAHVFDADQMERIAETLEDLTASAGAGTMHGMWRPLEKWVLRPFEPVLLRLRFAYRDVPPLIQYDVGTWRRGLTTDWDKCRSGTVTHCARIITPEIPDTEEQGGGLSHT